MKRPGAFMDAAASNPQSPSETDLETAYREATAATVNAANDLAVARAALEAAEHASKIAEDARTLAAQKRAQALPVDRSKVELTDGSTVTADHRDINPSTGQQKGYVVLSKEERAKGFVRPVRHTYRHVGAEGGDRLGHKADATGQAVTGCGGTTTMGLSLAETYARYPKFYSSTFCCYCMAHFPLDQFVWEGSQERVGS